MENEIAHVSLPPSLFEEPEAKGNESALVFSVYSSAALFPIANASGRYLRIISPTIAATLVGATIVDLKDPVVIVFRLYNQVGKRSYSVRTLAVMRYGTVHRCA